MAVALLTICHWRGAENRETVVENPTWPQIEAAIRNLNNRGLNDICLQPDRQNAETFLGIGGGDGQYIVTGAKNGQSFPTLVHADRPSEPNVELVVGGQLGAYPANWVSDLTSTLRATKAFYDAGGFSDDEQWVNV